MASTLKRILCVDDDQDILDVVKMCLETVSGYEVATCMTGADAFTVIRNVKPDIILLDVMIPGVDGPTIIKSLQADPEFRSIPVVFMTARVQPREISQYLSQGAVAVIAKPFDPMKIGQEILNAWQKVQGAR